MRSLLLARTKLHRARCKEDFLSHTQVRGRNLQYFGNLAGPSLPNVQVVHRARAPAAAGKSASRQGRQMARAHRKKTRRMLAPEGSAF